MKTITEDIKDQIIFVKRYENLTEGLDRKKKIVKDIISQVRENKMGELFLLQDLETLKGERDFLEDKLLTKKVKSTDSDSKLVSLKKNIFAINNRIEELRLSEITANKALDKLYTDIRKAEEILLPYKQKYLQNKKKVYSLSPLIAKYSKKEYTPSLKHITEDGFRRRKTSPRKSTKSVNIRRKTTPRKNKKSLSRIRRRKSLRKSSRR